MPSITLYIPNSQLLGKLSGQLEYHNTRDVLRTLAKELSSPLMKKRISYENENGAADAPLYARRVFQSIAQSKEDFARFSVLMLHDERNMRAFFSAIPENQANVYRELLLCHYLSTDELTKRFGYKLKETKPYSWEDNRKFNIPFLTYTFAGFDKDWNYTYQVSLYDGLRHFFYKPLLPGLSELVCCDELPEGLVLMEKEPPLYVYVLLIPSPAQEAASKYWGSPATAARESTSEFMSVPTITSTPSYVKAKFVSAALGSTVTSTPAPC